MRVASRAVGMGLQLAVAGFLLTPAILFAAMSWDLLSPERAITWGTAILLPLAMTIAFFEHQAKRLTDQARDSGEPPKEDLPRG